MTNFLRNRPPGYPRYWVYLAVLWLLAGSVAWAKKPGALPRPLAIGNTVFQDYNRNGVQDAGEPGFANVLVRLYQSGIQRGQTTTDANGQYNFTAANVPTGIRPNTTYEIRIMANDFPAGFNLTRYAPSSGTSIGNDARFIGNNAVVTVTTDASGNPAGVYGIGFAAGNPDLAITTSAVNSTVARGNNAAFTIQVNNTGNGTATSVVVSTTLDPGFTYVAASPTVASSTSSAAGTVLTWNLGTIVSGAPTRTLSFTAVAREEGVLYNTASVATTDTENNPSNNISRGCVSVPIKFCPGDSYVASLPAEYTNVQWFRNGSTTPIASGNSFTIVQSGSYSFTTTASASCPTGGCCPIIVEDGILPNLAITPATPAICNGLSTTLTATGCTSGTLIWNTLETTSSITVAPNATSVYSVSCNSTTYGVCSAVASATVTVNPSVTATLSSATICNGLSATLTAGGAGTGGNYVLNPGSLTSTTGTFVVSPTVNGVNTYTVTATSQFGCIGIATGTVTVNPSVTATLTSATICNGLSATLTAGGAGTSGNYVLNPGSLTSTTGTFVVSPTVNGVNTYTVTATSQFGCIGIATGTVTVNPSVTATLSSATICNGLSATLTAGGAGTGGNYVLNPGSLTSTTGTFVVSPTVNGVNTYTVTATSQFGCIGIATGTVTVNPSVTATLTSATICNGLSATLTAGGAGTGGNYVLNPGSLTSTTGTFVVSPTVNGVNTYTVTATSQFGCVGIATGTVTVNPSVTATLSSSTICNGNSATLTASGAGTGGNYVLNPGSLTSISGTFVVSPTVDGINTYTVTATSQFGCVGTATGTVLVNPTPILTLNAPANSVTLCAGGSTDLTITGCTAGTLTWSTGDNTATLSIMPLVTTTYSATCVFTEGCSSTIATTITVNPAPAYSVAPVATPATCNGATPNNDARVDLTTLVNTERAGISAGTSYTGPAYAAVTNQPDANGNLSFTGLANPLVRQPYTIRLFSATGTCFTDITVLLDPATCICPAPQCVPVIVRKVR